MNPNAIPTIDVTEADRRRREGEPPGILLDIREPDEIAEARAPDSVLLPMSQFPTRGASLPRDRQLLVICRSGNRSAAVTNYLVRAGYDAHNVAGGIIAWARAGLPLVSGAPAPGEGELPG